MNKIKKVSKEKRIARKNYILHSIEGGFYLGGTAFVSPEIVLPAILYFLGAESWMIATSPVLLLVGLFAPAIITAPIVSNLKTLKPFVVFFSFLQRLPPLITAFAIFYYSLYLNGAEKENFIDTLIYIVYLCPLFSGIFGGLGGPAWLEMVSRMVPTNRRASGWAIRNILQCLITLLAGVVIYELLLRYPSNFAYGLLHLISFYFIIFSLFMIIFMSEVETKDVKDKLSFKNYFSKLKSMSKLVYKSKTFLLFMLIRIGGCSYMIIMPFLSIYGLEKLNKGKETLGPFVIYSSIGAIIGNIIGAFVGDRSGGKILIIIARVVFILMLAFIPFAEKNWHFYLIFGITSFSLFLDRIGDITLVVEISPEKDRPIYLAFTTIGGIISFGISGICAIFFKQLNFSISVVSMYSLLIMLFFMFAVFLIYEPRKLNVRNIGVQ